MTFLEFEKERRNLVREVTSRAESLHLSIDGDLAIKALDARVNELKQHVRAFMVQTGDVKSKAEGGASV